MQLPIWRLLSFSGPAERDLCAQEYKDTEVASLLVLMLGENYMTAFKTSKPLRAMGHWHQDSG